MSKDVFTNGKNPFDKIGHFFRKILGVSCVFILLTMTSVTCLDVVARYLFNSPLDGAYELTEIFLATLIFLALPLTTLEGEHIEVELLDMFKENLGSNILKKIAAFISISILSILSYQVMLHALKLFERGQVTNSLEIPLYLIALLASLSLGLSALFIVLLTLSQSPDKQT